MNRVLQLSGAMQLTDAANSLGLSEREKDKYLGGVINFVFFAVGAPASVLVLTHCCLCQSGKLTQGNLLGKSAVGRHQCTMQGLSISKTMNRAGGVSDIPWMGSAKVCSQFLRGDLLSGYALKVCYEADVQALMHAT